MMHFRKVSVCIINLKASMQIPKTNETVYNKQTCFYLILCFINVEDQLNYKNLPLKLCMCLSNFTHNSPWSWVSSIFQSTFCVAINAIWWSNFLLEQVCYSSAIKWQITSFSSRFFLFFSANWLPQILHIATSIIPKKSKK